MHIVKTRIESELQGSRVIVRDFTGGGDHLEVNVIWPGFEELSRVKQHKAVYKAVKDLVGDGKPIHALSIKTWATEPEELASPSDGYFGQ